MHITLTHVVVFAAIVFGAVILWKNRARIGSALHV